MTRCRPRPAFRYSFATFIAIAVVSAALATLISPDARAQPLDWNEIGDAGDVVATAQTTLGAGALGHINGAFSDPSDIVDVYCIWIPDPAGFYAVFNCTSSVGPDLWLFDQNGNGVTMEDTCNSVVALTPDYITGGPGPYFLAISMDGAEAQSTLGSIWAPGSPATQRPPNGPGAAGALTGWSGGVTPMVIPYQISMLGAQSCENVVANERMSWGTAKSMYK